MKKNILTLAFAAAFMLTATNCRAQTLKNIISDVISAIKGNDVDMTGTWNYSSAAVEFESDNLLMKAGGAVAASTVEKKLDEELGKLGITEDKMSFTFSADSTFTSTIGSKKISGTYSYDSSTSEATLKFAKILSIDAKVNCSSNSMDLLFDANKVLTLLSTVGNLSGSSSIEAISSLISSYDGLLLGFTLTK